MAQVMQQEARLALEKAKTDACFVVVPSKFGNLLLPVFPRLE